MNKVEQNIYYLKDRRVTDEKSKTVFRIFFAVALASEI